MFCSLLAQFFWFSWLIHNDRVWESEIKFVECTICNYIRAYKEHSDIKSLAEMWNYCSFMAPITDIKTNMASGYQYECMKTKKMPLQKSGVITGAFEEKCGFLYCKFSLKFDGLYCSKLAPVHVTI